MQTPIYCYNQLYCGACWAISATSVLSDRFCITTNGTINEELSPQYLLSCDNNNRGCVGGTLFETWDFLENHGKVKNSFRIILIEVPHLINVFLISLSWENPLLVSYFKNALTIIQFVYISLNNSQPILFPLSMLLSKTS